MQAEKDAEWGWGTGMKPTHFMTLPIQLHASSARNQEGVKVKQIKETEVENTPGRHLPGSLTTNLRYFPSESKGRLLALNTFVLPWLHPRLNSSALLTLARKRIKLHWFPFFPPQTSVHQCKELRVKNVCNLGGG